MFYFQKEIMIKLGNREKRRYCMPSTYAHYRIRQEVRNHLGESERKVVEKHPGNDAYLSYVYGFICHFTLDETCHGYIDEKIAVSGISHTEIEV